MSFFTATIEMPAWVAMLIFGLIVLKSWVMTSATNRAQKLRNELAELNREQQIDWMRALLAHAPDEVRCNAAGLRMSAEILRYDAEQWDKAMACMKERQG